jgi:hypothetical protein
MIQDCGDWPLKRGPRRWHCGHGLNTNRRRTVVLGGQGEAAPGRLVLRPPDEDYDNGDGGAGSWGADGELGDIDSTWLAQPGPGAEWTHAAGPQPVPASERELPGTRRRRLDEQWAAATAALLKDIPRHISSHSCLRSAMQAAETACMQAHVRLEGMQCSACGAAEPRVVGQRSVVRIGIHQRSRLHIPVQQCDACGARCSVQPLQLMSMAAAPGTGSDLCGDRGTAGEAAVVWLGLELLELLSLQVSSSQYDCMYCIIAL